MGRTDRGGNRRGPKPVQKVQLSEKNIRGRIVLVILLLGIGAAFLVSGFLHFLRGESGWREISVKAGAETSCAEDFILKYNVGQNGAAAGGEARTISLLYTDAAVKGYRLFHVDESFEGMQNLYDINHHLNEVLEVDEVLYQALKLAVEQGHREIFLAPLYANYENLCSSVDDTAAELFDPERNEDIREEFDTVLAWIRDPEAVSLEFPEENKVCLRVCEEYLSYAEEMGYTAFVDFGWMKNAFLLDYFADTLAKEGYLAGIISSRDGFVRCLDEGGEKEYTFPLYHREGTEVQKLSTLTYQGAQSIVYLHDYPMSATEQYRYYTYADGTMRSPYLRTTDGTCTTGLPELATYSSTKSCAEILLTVLPLYQEDSFSEEKAKKTAEENDMHFLWFAKDGSCQSSDS